MGADLMMTRFKQRSGGGSFSLLDERSVTLQMFASGSKISVYSKPFKKNDVQEQYEKWMLEPDQDLP